MAPLRSVWSYWKQAWPDALACALAGALAWLLARALFHHPQPIFASVAAVVCLAPGIPSRAGQALNMMLGLVTGIVVGEAVLLLAPPMPTALLIATIVFLAIMAAMCFGLVPVIAIQGGISALLVVALGPEAAGAARFLDALAGTAIGLLFSQLLLTPDPARLIERAAAQLLGAISEALAMLAEAAETATGKQAAAARTRLIAARESVNLLQVRISSAESIVRWSVRGRLRSGATRRLTLLYQCRGIVLHAAALVLADALTTRLSEGTQPPRSLGARIRHVAAALQSLATGKGPPPRPEATLSPEPDWRPCFESLDAIERLVTVLDEARRRGVDED
jgi:uncharacterized membrane protein YgaE (UPF0421/DUF939 family)